MTFEWFILFLFLLIIELMTVNLVSIWFAIGAIASMISTIWTDSFIVQLIVFIVVSLISLIITKPIVHKLKKDNFVPTNSDRVIGKVGKVTKDIGVNNYGEVVVFGNTWTAVSSSNIPVGSKVKVLAIEGVKLIVEEEK